VLKQIKGAVLFRPFAEANGNWFWYRKQNPAQFIAMWRDLHNSLTVAGVSNLVWVYAINAGVGNYAIYYSGPAYADVVGEDAYPPSTADASVWSALTSAAPGAPQIYSEQGTNPHQSSSTIPSNSYDSETYFQLIESNFPNVVGIVKWCQADALDNQNGAAQVVNDPNVITLAQLPGFNRSQNRSIKK
jgi:mannan endo-1,4-beta-mannosidase